MKRNIIMIIYVETSFRHAKNSPAFVSGRLLRFHLHVPKFNQILATCLYLLPSDLVTMS